MKGLILKDFYLIKKHIVLLLIIVIAFSFSFYESNTIIYQSIFSALITGSTVMTTFAYDEQRKWTRFAQTMPISRKQYICSKFLFTIIMSTMGAAIGVITSFIASLINSNISINASSVIFSLIFATLIGVSLNTILIPLLLKFGVEKTRIMRFFVLGIPMAVIVLITGILKENFDISQEFILGLKFVIPISLIIFIYIIYLISVRIFKKKDI